MVFFSVFKVKTHKAKTNLLLIVWPYVRDVYLLITESRFLCFAGSWGRLLAAGNPPSSLALSPGRVWVSGSACQAAAQLPSLTGLRKWQCKTLLIIGELGLTLPTWELLNNMFLLYQEVFMHTWLQQERFGEGWKLSESELDEINHAVLDITHPNNMLCKYQTGCWVIC